MNAAARPAIGYTISEARRVTSRQIVQTEPQRYDRIAKELARRFGVTGHADANGFPIAKGAYLLLLELGAELPLAIRKFQHDTLPAGLYLYAGSARGPGGLKARLRRHLRADKKPHWHIDRLANAATRMTAFAIPDGRECALVQSLLESEQYHHPLPGFGSSDCRICTSHLLSPL